MERPGSVMYVVVNFKHKKRFTRKENNMDKYMEVLCSQNPKIDLECQNSKCKKKITIKSIELFKHKEFIYKCPKCGITSTYDTTKFVKKYTEGMKKLGFK